MTPMSPRTTVSEPLRWRIPPAQVALLFLLVSACAATNIYLHPSLALRVVTLVGGVAAFGAAVSGARMFLYVDDDGVAVRRIRRTRWVAWHDLAGVEVAQHASGSPTMRFLLADGDHVDVPPSLLQPARPTRKPVAMQRLRDAVEEVTRRRPR